MNIVIFSTCSHIYPKKDPLVEEQCCLHTNQELQFFYFLRILYWPFQNHYFHYFRWYPK